MSKRFAILLVFLSALSFYLAFNAGIPVTDPVESNYALTAKEMMQSGDWLSPRIYGHYWFDKPIMIYWLIGISYQLFGVNEFAARFSPAFFGAASVAFAYWFAAELYGNKKTALFVALVLGTSLEFWVLSKMIITDATLFFYTSVSLATFYLGICRGGSGWYVLAYGSAALAVLTKGPVGLVLPAIIIFFYILVTRQWNLIKRLFVLPGMAVFLLIAGPWYFLMVELHGHEFVDTFLGLHNYIRATVSEHPSDNVFYYYLVLFPVSLMPWTGVFFRAIFRACKGIKPPHVVYLAVWMGVTLVFYTLMATKYLTYVFPASFPAALLMGHCLKEMQALSGRKQWLWLSVPVVLFFVTIAIAGTEFLPFAQGWEWMYVATGIAVLSILWLQFRGNVRLLPQAAGLAVIMVSLVLVHNALIPWATIRSAKDLVKAVPQSGAEVASYGDYETSAVFYSGYKIPHLTATGEGRSEGECLGWKVHHAYGEHGCF